MEICQFLLISSRFLKTLSVPSWAEKGLHENLIRKKYFSWEKDEKDEREKHINPQNKINSYTQKFLWGGKRFSSHIPRLFISFFRSHDSPPKDKRRRFRKRDNGGERKAEVYSVSSWRWKGGGRFIIYGCVSESPERFRHSEGLSMKSFRRPL